MDVDVGGAEEDGRAPRGTLMCVANADAAEADDEGVIPLPVFTLQDFQRLNVAPAVSTVEPAPDTLKNMNTNVFAVADAQAFQAELGGFPVAVRAYPVQYTWNYGDGAEHIAAVHAFLVSEENSRMTGQVLFVDGGFDALSRGDDIW